MIVPGMTPKEVANDARQDLKALMNKIRQRWKEQERDLRKSPKHISLIEQCLRWPSPRGNNWIIVISSTRKETNVSGLVRFRGTDLRLRAVRVNLLQNGPDIYYSAHFLERYLKRFNKSKDPLERLEEFFAANHTPAVQAIKDLGNGRQEVMCGMLHGNGTGEWDTTDNTVRLTTFLDHGTLFPEQQVLTESLDMQRYFSMFTPGQRAHMLREMEAELDKQEASAQAPDPHKEKLLALMRQWAQLPEQGEAGKV